MKTSELKYHLKQLSEEIDIDIKVEKASYENTLEIRVNSYYFAKVDKNALGVFSIKLQSYHSLSRRAYVKLLSIIADYASTPVEKREDYKKYYIVCNHPSYNQNHKYLNRNTCDGVRISLGVKEEGSLHQTQFTESEIEQYGLQTFVSNELFELVEVKENE